MFPLIVTFNWSILVDNASSAVAIACDHSVMLEFTSSKDAEIWPNFSALDVSCVESAVDTSDTFELIVLVSDELRLLIASVRAFFSSAIALSILVTLLVTLLSSVEIDALTPLIASARALASSAIALSRRETLASVLLSRLLTLALTLLIASARALASSAIAVSTLAISAFVFLCPFLYFASITVLILLCAIELLISARDAFCRPAFA